MPKKLPLGKKISERDSSFGERSVRMKVHVTYDGTFNIPVPEFAIPVLGYPLVSGKVKDKTVRAWEKAGREYAERLTAKEKVIVYEVEVTAIVWDKDHERVIFREDNLSFARGTGLAMDYTVCYRHSRPDREETSYHLDDGRLVHSHYRSSKVKYIPWTQEAEAFFSECEHRLEVLAMGLHNFLNEQDPKLVADKIEEAMGLLEFKGDEKHEKN